MIAEADVLWGMAVSFFLGNHTHIQLPLKPCVLEQWVCTLFGGALNREIIALLLPNSNFATVMNYDVTI